MLVAVLHSVATRWIDPARSTLIALGVASTLALIAALAITRARPIHGLTEGRRLLERIGWPVLLPMLLATLGGVFAETDVGDAIARLDRPGDPDRQRGSPACSPTGSAWSCSRRSWATRSRRFR